MSKKDPNHSLKTKFANSHFITYFNFKKHPWPQNLKHYSFLFMVLFLLILFIWANVSLSKHFDAWAGFLDFIVCFGVISSLIYFIGNIALKHHTKKKLTQQGTNEDIITEAIVKSESKDTSSQTNPNTNNTANMTPIVFTNEQITNPNTPLTPQQKNTLYQNGYNTDPRTGRLLYPDDTQNPIKAIYNDNVNIDGRTGQDDAIYHTNNHRNSTRPQIDIDNNMPTDIK